MASRKNPGFQLVAGHAALDLINTLDNRFSPSGPDDLLRDYDDLLQFCAQSRLLNATLTRQLKLQRTGGSARASVLRRVKELRDSLAAVLYASVDQKKPSDADLLLIEKLFKRAAASRRLDWKDGRLTWVWPRAIEAALPLWLLAQDAADLLASEQLTRLRSCANRTCRWLFLDTSKNHTRRWCDMKLCGNRMKAKKFQARQRRG